VSGVGGGGGSGFKNRLLHVLHLPILGLSTTVVNDTINYVNFYLHSYFNSCIPSPYC
jgi:hypothetical protein